MKKFTLTAILGLFATLATTTQANTTPPPLNNIGIGLAFQNSTYSKTQDFNGIGLIADYAVEYGNNFFGIIEGKAKLNRSTLKYKKQPELFLKQTEKWHTSVSYLQGYRSMPNVLVYLKAGYSLRKFKEERQLSATEYRSSTTTSGALLLGLGAKMAVSPNVEFGIEYSTSRPKIGNEKVTDQTIALSTIYRF